MTYACVARFNTDSEIRKVKLNLSMTDTPEVDRDFWGIVITTVFQRPVQVNRQPVHNEAAENIFSVIFMENILHIAHPAG